MSDTEWNQNTDQPSWSLDTPVGRATILQETNEGKWVAQLDIDESTRQSELLETRDEAESWVATQVESVQRESDVAAADEEFPDEE